MLDIELIIAIHDHPENADGHVEAKGGYFWKKNTTKWKRLIMIP